jgi:RNA polymerase sigma-70 factor (ECF subfamily)
MTERTLVEAAQAGFSEAADELVERYYPRVYSFVAAQKGADAEDLTQEVFARALGALPRFNGEYQFGAWLLQIARNVCIDEARRQVHRPQPTDPIDLVELEPVGARPDDVWESVSSQIAVGTVHRALARLPARQRTVLVLRELEGMSYADIAIALRVSTRAVEISLSRARKRMRVELKRLDLVEGELAACRRAATLLASNPTAVSSEEVAAHLRQCPICQSMARRRHPRDLMHGAWAVLLAGPAGAGEGLRRLLGWSQRVGQGILASSGTSTLAPLSRLAEVGATVAMATAVSAGTFARPAPAPVPAVAVSAPVVIPVQPPTVDVVSPPPAQASPAAPVTAPAAGGPIAASQQVATELACALNAVRAGTAQNGAAGVHGVISQVLSPVNALTPVLSCNPALAGVGAGTQAAASALGSGLSGSPPGSAQASAGAVGLLNKLLGGQESANN